MIKITAVRTDCVCWSICYCGLDYTCFLVIVVIEIVFERHTIYFIMSCSCWFIVWLHYERFFSHHQTDDKLLADYEIRISKKKKKFSLVNSRSSGPRHDEYVSQNNNLKDVNKWEFFCFKCQRLKSDLWSHWLHILVIVKNVRMLAHHTYSEILVWWALGAR